MPDVVFNKFRAAVEVLQRGRDVLVEAVADEIVEQGDDLIEGGYLFHELLETQGTRIHFLCLLLSQLEQSAEAFDEAHPSPPPKPPVKRRTRPKKLPSKASQENSTDDV